MADETTTGAAGAARVAAEGDGRATRPDPILLREFPGFGRCRVRLVRSSGSPRARTVLDVREYAKSETFEGFTRRGIRIASLAEARALREALAAIEDEKLLP
jgi:hypothetical protein